MKYKRQHRGVTPGLELLMANENGRIASWVRQLGLTIAGLGVALAACSSEPDSHESLGSSSQALTSTQQRIFGFESVGAGSTDWTTSAGTLSQSTRHVEGAHSLAIANGGNAEIKSAALSSLGPIADKITLDLLLPAAQPNPYWMGTLKLVIECPSQQLSYEGLAEYQLQGRPTEQFLRFDFPLSASTRQKLSTGTYSDLRFKILLNVAAGAGPWLLDRLSVTDAGGGGTGGAGAGGNTGTGGTGGAGGSSGASSSGGSSGSSNREVTFRIVTPKGVLPTDVAVSAASSLRLNDGVSLRLANGTGNSSASSAGNPGSSYLGVNASLLNLASIGSVELRNGALVRGNLTTSGTASLEVGASIQGTRVEGASLLPRNVVSWKVSFPLPNSGPVALEPNVTRILDPGNYGSLSVKSGAHLKLRRGTYRFEDGAIEPNGYIDVDNSAGPVFIYFRSGLLWNGITNPQTAADNVLFGVGALSNQLGSPWKGFLVANGSASLISALGIGHEGSVFADDIVLHQSTPFRHHPFVPNNFCDPQNATECGPFCPCDTGSACDSTLECRSGLTCVVGTCRDCANGGCEGATCSPSSSCQPGLACAAGVCRALCDAYPDAFGCVAPHCANGVKDGAESDVDCGGDCPGCGSGGTCTGETNDCAVGLVCSGQQCVPPGCIADGDCPTTGSECSDTVTCTNGMSCPANLNGWRFGQPGKRICEPANCCSDPSQIGTRTPECGLCVCKPNCSSKTCGSANLDDGCGNRCIAVCDPGETGCQQDSDCTGGNLCRGQKCVPSSICGQASLAPPNCGPNALCGPCPSNPSASCNDRECGADPVSGASCGTCGTGNFCNSAGRCALLDSTPPIQVAKAGGGMRPVIPGPAPSAPTRLGGTPGSFAVTDRGSASYSIALEFPPGRAGIEPSLALRYTSSTGNGAMGVGWSLDGLSSIARCGRTFAQNGFVKGVVGDQSDAFCLDGQQLVEVAPSEYRTQVDTFAKIVAVGSTGSGPEYFKVYSKDGRILTYGSSPNSKNILRGSVVGAWALNRAEDRAGNYMRLTYEQTMGTTNAGEASTAELVAGAITYTGFGSTDGDREIVFKYDTNRGDSIRGYRPGGGAFARSKILSNIEVRAGGQLVRRYRLSYEESINKAQRLTSLEECAGPTSAACHHATAFGYFDEQGFEPGVDKAIPPEKGTSVSPNLFAAGIVHKSSDGRDLLTTLTKNVTNNIITPFPLGLSMPVSVVPVFGPIASAYIDLANTFAATSSADVLYKSYTFDMVTSSSLLGAFSCQGDLPPRRQLIGNGSFGAETLRDSCPEKREVDPRSQEHVYATYQQRQWLVDLNGDGMQDVVYCVDDPRPARKWGPMHLDYRLASPTTGDTQPPFPAAHAARTGELSQWGRFCDPYQAQQYSIVLDVDNDGTANLLAYDATLGWAALMPTGSTYEWQTAPVAGLTLDANYHYYVVPIDANGDGLRDFLALPWAQAFAADEFLAAQSPVIAFNTGHGFRQELLTALKDGIGRATAGTSPNDGAFVFDIDQDGIEELVFPDPDARKAAAPWRVGRVRDGQFLNEAIPSLVEGPGVLGDFDGDGDIDAFTRAFSWEPFPTRHNYRFHSGKGRRQNLLGSVTEGSGHRIIVSYNDSNVLGAVYKKALPSGHCAWPQQCMARVDHALVSNHVELHMEDLAQTRVGLDRFYNYQYEGARLDVAGYGWLGFSRRTIDVEDGENVSLGYTTIDYNDPEPFVVGSSQIPYSYLKAGLPKSSYEIGPSLDGFDGAAISASTNHRTTTSRTFNYAQKTSAFGRPYVFLSHSITLASGTCQRV